MPDTYVALDLETTGLEPHRHEIIEVGAVRFSGKQVLGTFSTFVKPTKGIPAEIQEMTGITPEDVRTAPLFAVVAGDLLQFVGDSVLVIQNAGFDLGFLNAQGLPLSNRVLDTLELAKVLLGGLPERNLGALAAHFGLEYHGQHRALPDAHAAKDVFLALRERAVALDIKLLGHLATLGAKTEWALQAFFEEVMADRIAMALAESVDLAAAAPLSPSGRGLGAVLSPSKGRGPSLGVESPPERSATLRRGEVASPAGEPPLVDADLLARLLGPNGAFARAFPSFEHRPEQVAMTRAVAGALNNKQHLVVEAGTGTGKSMAYLLPALVHAVQTGSPVVVATNTIALQDQVIAKDLPALMQVLAFIQQEAKNHERAQGGNATAGTLPSLDRARYTVLKGRGNYLCPRRWNAALSGGAGIDPPLLARITVWLAGTSTGDRAEMNLNASESFAWRRLSAETDNCPASQCNQVRAADCFLQRARQKAAEAHIVVVNHALLVADMVAGGSVLPDYDFLVVDEAHHLEAVATDQLGFRISHSEVTALLDRLDHESSVRAQGVLADLEALLRTGSPLFNGVALQQLASVRSRVPPARTRSTLLFGLLADFLEDANGPSDYGRRIRLTPATRHHHLWERVEQAWEDLRLVLLDLREGLERLALALKSISDTRPDDYEGSLAELEMLHASCGSLVDNGNAAMASPDPDWVVWVVSSGGGAAPSTPEAQTGTLPALPEKTSRGEGTAIIYAAPIEVGPMLAKDLFQKKAGVVLTSATLRTADGFGYIESRLGLEKPVELAMESSFPYRETALLLLPQDIPNPRQPNYYRAMEQALAGLCLASKGRALLLFTSYSALQSANRALKEALEPEGLRVLAQGGGMSVQRLLDQLRSRPDTVLLGTNSFWEGVDVVGEALSLLVITRLPFNVPTEPVFQARSERFEDPFAEYAVPQAVLRFRQGFGRLIRSRTDRGVCVVLDPRLGTMRYGKSFLDALPPATVRKCTLREAPAQVAAWLAPLTAAPTTAAR